MNKGNIGYNIIFGLMSTGEVSRAEAWMMAARPQTLPAGAAPIVVGAGLAAYEGVFVADLAAAALVTMLLNQVGMNVANDYYDAVRGVDVDEQEGFTRVTHAGILPAGRVKRAMWATYGVVLLAGLYPVYVGGLPIALAGLALVAAGFAYSGGPSPYGDYGLGDPAVFLVFGLIPVPATYYLLAAGAAGIEPLALGFRPELLPAAVVVASLAPAGLATCLLIINNVRDRETDADAGKRTIPVRFGYFWGRVEYVAMLGLGYLSPVVLWLGYGFEPWVLLPLASLPLAASVTRRVLAHTSGEVLNPTLERMGQLIALHAALFAAGLCLPAVL